MKPEILGIIPARGGSKGVPLKNRRLVAGKPLIQYSIDAALRSKRLTMVVVSTDDPAIREIAHASGVEVIDRPAHMAGDTSPVIDAVRHALETLETNGRSKPQAIVLLQPTAPLRTCEDIDRAIELFYDKGLNPVCSVSRCEDNHPARMYTLDETGALAPFMTELAVLRRQDLPPVYHRNGALYVFGQQELAGGQIIVPGMTPYVMDARKSLNVDTDLDLLILDAMLSRQ
jgi:CMP-N,N'-diacetyllegionaminic acid synthase